MAVCLIAEAFFSGSEIGVVSADKMLLRHKAAEGSKGAKIALWMLEKPEWLLSTTLVGTNIAMVTNTTIAAALVIELLGQEYSWVAVVLVAPLIWVFGEIVPKSVFQQHANSITPWVIFPLRAASVLFSPLLIVFTLLTRLFARAFGGAEDSNPFTLREEISTMMDMSPADGGDIEPEEKSMIRRVFDFSETDVEEIMVPLIDVVGVEKSATCAEAVRIAVEQAHKRLVVFDERVDRVVGILNTLDILNAGDEDPITPHIRDTVYVPRSKSVEDLLRFLRSRRQHIAVVVDEFGGADGIVTLEDIIEEVVGELEDEFDEHDQPVSYRKIGEKDYLLSGRTPIDVVQDELNIPLPEGEYETVAGFLLELANDIPAAGSVVRYKNLEFRIERSTDRAIREVRLRWED